jgi:glutamate N-acetyltransferase/amino-acid N-acetyltransferase
MNSLTGPRGFRAAGVPCGIKPDRLDLAVIAADAPAQAAALFTTNRAQAAPVLVSREHLKGGRARAVVVNSGCANAATGATGLADAREMAALTAAALGCAPAEVVVASTGVIGVDLPMPRLRSGIPAAVAALSVDGSDDAARAILTTDTGPKHVHVPFSMGSASASIGGIAKGAGMIAPNMATMLAFLTTDADIEPDLLKDALREAVAESFNRITVDGDTSTNDMVLILASGRSDLPAIQSQDEVYREFRAALTQACRTLASAIVRDGEGATRVAEVRVEGARTAQDADRIARVIGESLLVKTAIFGRDPNWGRVLGALGRAGVELDVAQVDIYFGDVCVAREGRAAQYSESEAKATLDEDPARIVVRLREGVARGWIWTCDLTHSYVDINASYRS